MKKHSSDIIILNGQHFNAKTGQALAALQTAQPARNVDGILPKHVTAAVLQKPSQYTQPLKTVVKKPVMDMARTPAMHAQNRTLQPGQTLMRRALTKPALGLKRTTKVLVPNQQKAAITLTNLQPKTSAAVIDSGKLRRAQVTPKSDAISRFVSGSQTPVATVTTISSMARRAIVAKQTAAAAAAKPSLDVFERALASARGHEEQTPPHVIKSLRHARKGQRQRTIAGAALAVALLFGFIGYRQLPAMQFQYASSQAGFHAALPGYLPSGFSLGKLSYQAGAVNVNFHSNSDDRTFAITQKASGWDSQALVDNFVTTTGQPYHSIEAGGRSIYLYGSNNATWVNGGVWYTVVSNGNLSERQVTQIADSL